MNINDIFCYELHEENNNEKFIADAISKQFIAIIKKLVCQMDNISSYLYIKSDNYAFKKKIYK